MMSDSPAALSQLKRIQRNSVLWLCVLLVLFGGLLARVLQLKVAPSPRLAGAAGDPYASTTEFARRGDIVDREGRIIATSSTGYRLFVDPQVVDDPFTIAVRVAQLVGGDPAQYDQRIFARPDSRYVVLNHQLTGAQVEAIRSSPIRGVGLTPRLVREYTNDAVGGIVVGRVGFDHTGQGGMEHRYNTRLSPTDGSLTYLRDSGGRALWIDPTDYLRRNDGGDVRLSLDMAIQEQAEQRLTAAVEQCNAGGGRLIVLDSRTGEILAMCDVLRSREGWDEFTEDTARETHISLGRNRCATDPYEPGSTFKPFIWAVATEAGLARLDEELDTPGAPGPYITSRGRRIRDSHYYGPSTWERVLVKSMNSGMAIVAERFTDAEMQDTIARWGFGRATGSGLPGEARGIVTSSKKWNHYSQTSVAYGHEICVTPLQMVQAFAAFARDGSMPQLRMTSVQQDVIAMPVVQQVISPEVAKLTRRVLHRVMKEGTGRRADETAKYTMFGKSGTAQLPKREGGGYHEHRYVSSFIGGAPLNDPRLVVLCVIDDPDRRIAHYGGEVAGPVVTAIINDALGYLGVEPDYETGFTPSDP